MKIKINKNHFNIKIIAFIIYNIIYTLYMLGYVSRNINLVSLFIFMIVCLMNMKKEKKYKFQKEFFAIIGFISFLLLYTLIVQMIHSDVNIRQMSGLLYLIAAISSAFLIINTTDEIVIKDYLNVVFIRMIALFVLKNITNFSLTNLQAINWFDSYSSVFESSMAHEFMIFTIIYKYFKENKLSFLSMILCVLCFKRLAMIVAVLFFIFYNEKFFEKPVGKYMINITKAFFMISPFILMFMISDSGQVLFNKIFHISLNEFSTGRSYIINVVKNGMEYFNGYGSTSYYLKTIIRDRYVEDIHCDLLRLTWECSYISVLLYVNIIINMVKRNKLLFVIVLYCLLEMFVSHFLEGYSIWLVIYLFIYIVLNNKKGEKENYG